MVKAIIVGEVPTAEVTCGNCHSVLRYGNADLIKTYPKETWTSQLLYKVEYYSFRCPICGLEVRANWIEPKQEETINT